MTYKVTYGVKSYHEYRVAVIRARTDKAAMTKAQKLYGADARVEYLGAMLPPAPGSVAEERCWRG